MKKWIRRIVMLLLLAVFLGSGAMVISIWWQYRVSQNLYEDAAERFVIQREEPAVSEPPVEEARAPSAQPGQISPGGEAVTLRPAELPVEETDREETIPPRSPELAPFAVDFAALQAEGKDVVGWIYCEGTIINYPVVQTSDNDYYLHRSYKGEYNFPGSIFVEAMNRFGFQDYNTIIYGHNMRDNTMFAVLEKWASQSFYEEHPVIWLLTPEQDYKIELLAGYTTAAGSEAYQIFSEDGEAVDAYISAAMGRSDFQPAAEAVPGARYVMLSTCAYVFSDARYVLHGMLCPVSSAGGIPIAE